MLHAVFADIPPFSPFPHKKFFLFNLYLPIRFFVLSVPYRLLFFTQLSQTLLPCSAGQSLVIAAITRITALTAATEVSSARFILNEFCRVKYLFRPSAFSFADGITSSQMTAPLCIPNLTSLVPRRQYSS